MGLGWLTSIVSSLAKSKEESESFDHLSGEDLIEAYQRGECEFDLILQRFHPLLIKRTMVWVVGIDKEDLYQELIIKTLCCCRHWKREHKTKFVTYLFTSLDNHIKKIIRESNAQKRTTELEQVSYEALLELEGEIPLECPQYFEDEVELDLLIEGLDLDPNERVCVEMIYEGHMNVDIADKLNLSGVRISQIVKALKPKFEFMIS
jgi:RNA polymerase sigma factor (sigma-70 family)